MSSPFQKSFSAKSPMSPLNGAYTSGAGGRVTISDAPHFAKLQSDLVGAVDKAYAKNSNPCDDPNTVQYTEDSVLKMSPKEQAKHGEFEVFKKAGIDYINNYERINGKGSWSARGRTKDKTFEQDQTKTNRYTTDIKGVETLTEEGEYVNVGDRRQTR